MEQAQERFAAICDAALAGEVVRLQLANGALLELKPVLTSPTGSKLSDQALADSYDDAEWAAFENHCAKASD